MTAAVAGCGNFEYTHRWPVIGWPLDADKRELLDNRDRELEEWLNRCRCKCGDPTCGPFEYTHRWSQFPDDPTPEGIIALLEDHDRELELFMATNFCCCESSHPEG